MQFSLVNGLLELFSTYWQVQPWLCWCSYLHFPAFVYHWWGNYWDGQFRTTRSSWICSIKENRGNWLPLLHFLGVIRWVDVVLLTPTVTNICSKANSALNEVRFRRTDFGFSAQGLNLLRVMKRTQPRAFLPSKSSLFWWIFLLIEKNFVYQETLRSPLK